MEGRVLDLANKLKAVISVVESMAEEISSIREAVESARDKSDMRDFRNWQAGDIIVCLDSADHQFTRLKPYSFSGKVSDSGNIGVFCDDSGDENGWGFYKFVWAERPEADSQVGFGFDRESGIAVYADQLSQAIQSMCDLKDALITHKFVDHQVSHALAKNAMFIIGNLEHSLLEHIQNNRT